MPTTLEDLNTSGRESFVATLGRLFEHSPWVAAATWPKRPFATAETLHAALCATMRTAPSEQQLELIRAHPDLAGRLARANRLTTESALEQAGAGLDRLTEAELGEFTRLNDAYRAKFGFPFIICARLNAKTAILAAMQARLSNDPGAERAAALAEIEKIAWLRLQDTLATTNPH
jgi:2-oxo-4-hydroxy-4-carboxy-5-ureidoimidazoline decarboxylase